MLITRNSDGVLGCPSLQLSGQRQASYVRKFFQFPVIFVTAFRRAFKVIITVIACYFIWSVSQASIDGWGIRLPLTLKKWHRQAD
jgi:hypothetical protein